MLRITVELWPHGDEKRKTTLATADIGNTGAGDETHGYYEYRIRGKSGQMVRRGFLGAYRRRDFSVWWLLAAVLRYAFPDVESTFYGEPKHKAVDPIKTRPIEPD